MSDSCKRRSFATQENYPPKKNPAQTPKHQRGGSPQECHINDEESNYLYFAQKETTQENTRIYKENKPDLDVVHVRPPAVSQPSPLTIRTRLLPQSRKFMSKGTHVRIQKVLFRPKGLLACVFASSHALNRI